MKPKSLWLAALALTTTMTSPAWSAPRTVGDEILVNSNSESKQRNPVAAFHPSGRYLVVWENDKNGLRGRFFSREGRPVSNELGLVGNDVPSAVPFIGEVSVRKDPALAMLASGDFFLFWTEERAHLRTDIFYESRTVLDQDVFGQRFFADGRPSGTPFRVGTTTAGNQARPKAVLLQNGRVLVVWEGTGVYGRILSRNGQFLTDEVKVANFHRLIGNAAPAVNSAGDILIAWESTDGDRQG
ncbi:MAG TPA: hypothetical protein VHN15_05215, partial [Thermoanaerobaculia bacterium]|nr:hypothetical protein [Thermoanaerobaculia bacterium]